VLETAGKPGTLAGHDAVLTAANRDGERAGLDPHHLAGTRYMLLAAERLAGHYLPAPQFSAPRWVGGAEYLAGAAGLAVPEHTRYVADAHARRGADVDEQRGRHPECVAEPGQRGEIRVRPALLERHEHALAHTRTSGELIQRPAVFGAQRLHGARHHA
jgi:hypothetical protein